jgi:hypothetical protein
MRGSHAHTGESMDETEQVEFIGNVCKNFAYAMNESSGTRFSGQDSYEVLSLVFGETFGPAQLHSPTAEQMRDLSMAVWELLESRVTPEAVAAALDHALRTTG